MSFHRVPVVDVHKDNLAELWPSLILAMSSSSFIALDTELSGLGQRKMLQAKSVEDRYLAISETTRSRSILSLGICCFKLDRNCHELSVEPGDSQPEGPDQSTASYTVQTFNILLLCQDEYTVEPASLRFLVDHGFDFNRQYAKGISYYRGPDQILPHLLQHKTPYQSVRQLFTELVRLQVPIILHNGLVDLMFLYQNLYANLPQSSATFIANLVDMFPAGILDSKYITDFEHRMPASYLEYVFRKCQRDNGEAKEEGIQILFPTYSASCPHVTYRNCRLKPDTQLSADQLQEIVCGNYAGHGWCSKGPHCHKSHDIDLILDLDSMAHTRKSRKRKRRKHHKQQREGESDVSMDVGNTTENTEINDHASNGDLVVLETSGTTVETVVEQRKQDIPAAAQELTNENSPSSCKSAQNVAMEPANQAVPETEPANQLAGQLCVQCQRQLEEGVSGGHRAGYDAFMTGFIVAVYLGRHGVQGGADSHVTEWRNKLYLSGKDYPLCIVKSSFAKSSKEHLEKLACIRQVSS